MQALTAMPRLTAGEALAVARRRLTGEAASLEGRRLLSAIMGQPVAWLYAHPEVVLTEAQAGQFIQALDKRAMGYPLAYILGRQGFYRWEFVVNPAVLIPRPETELLVEAAYDLLQTRPQATIVDVGTGSGIIAIALALLLPPSRVLGIDLSRETLAVAEVNAQRLSVANVQFVHGDLLEGLPTGIKADLIAANLPYIRSEELATLEVARWEPHLALDGGADGMDLIRRLLAQASDYLHRGGKVVLEIGADQGEAARALAARYVADARVTLRRDLNGLDRLVILELPETT